MAIERPTERRPGEIVASEEETYRQTYSASGLEEHVVVETFISPLLEGLPNNVIEILYYSATEMLNNAIDHSEGGKIDVIVIRNPVEIQIWIVDDGIGIFNKIKKVLQLDDPRDTILELCKGKLTTDPTHHTGEGIFFTSRACDGFYIISGTLRFGRMDETDWLVEAEAQLRKGTAVSMQVRRNCPKTLEETFKRFTADDEEFGFTRTIVPISIAEYGPDGLISRSKAKRVVNRFGKFKEVILDFDNVESIGQAFADEIFRVFESAHPDVHISVINANQSVVRMIRRAASNKPDGPIT